MSIIIGILEEGLIYAILALGVYITYKILDFPDLSVDGTFPMGAAVTAMLIMKGVPPLLTLFLAFLAGALAGCVTGFIHVKLRVRDLLSGIIMMTALYSLNLRIAGKANLPIFSKDTIFDNGFLEQVVPEPVKPYLVVLILLLITIVCKILLDLYLNTRSGYLLRAVGDNEVLVTSLARDKGMVKLAGLAVANGFVALAGCVYCQQKGFFEISTGTGAIVIGLANVIIGTKLFKNFHWFFGRVKGDKGKEIKPRDGLRATTAVILGSLVYRSCVALAISLGMAASDLKLVTAVLFLIILVLSSKKGKKVNGHA
ncbi:MAG: ABC transporter permease [Lachnospiraceae bacterium]|jgi:putative ABC transport system permease protein|nr:ABC transporter permease [Lachnospiraceae bacterium]